MNDVELTAGLTTFHREGASRPEPAGLRHEVASIPAMHPASRRRMPHFQGRFQAMFSATRFVVAGVIVALTGGLALTATQTGPERDQRLPGVGASASSAARRRQRRAGT